MKGIKASRKKDTNEKSEGGWGKDGKWHIPILPTDNKRPQGVIDIDSLEGSLNYRPDWRIDDPPTKKMKTGTTSRHFPGRLELTSSTPIRQTRLDRELAMRGLSSRPTDAFAHSFDKSDGTEILEEFKSAVKVPGDGNRKARGLRQPSQQYRGRPLVSDKEFNLSWVMFKGDTIPGLIVRVGEKITFLQGDKLEEQFRIQEVSIVTVY
jgi:hypothetical protein